MSEMSFWVVMAGLVCVSIACMGSMNKNDRLEAEIARLESVEEQLIEAQAKISESAKLTIDYWSEIGCPGNEW